ncbi:MAG: hypothetical protein FWE67_14355 [Planctomycetaceae bacterium]|nr:hypothetical protein [Planctomycetaceae bacterium]
MHTRRDFLTTAAVTSLGLTAMSRFVHAAETNALPPIRRITNGPKFHWRAYYDHDLVDKTNRFVLSHQVDFEHRSPKPDDTIRIGMIDLKDNNRWTELGSSKAWNWQQGSQLQWVPGTESTAIWNDREKDRFVARMLDVKGKNIITLDNPIYALSPDGKWGFYPDFRRLNDTRPGYGYCGIDDPNTDVLAPEDAGIWRIELATGKSELIVPFSTLAAMVPPEGFAKGAKHWFNHLIVAPDGKRFLFLHRYHRETGKPNWWTRLVTANIDGSDLFLMNPHQMTSHLVWRDPTHVLAWAKHPSHGDKFYVFTDKTGEAELVGGDVMTRDGHCTYVPKTNNNWILYDTYPDKERNQNPMLYHIPSGKVVPLGHFFLPKEYSGEWRCDTHPNADRNGQFVTIDSVHENLGRQVYLIDIRGIVNT